MCLTLAIGPEQVAGRVRVIIVDAYTATGHDGVANDKTVLFIMYIILYRLVDRTVKTMRTIDRSSVDCRLSV